MKKMFAVFLVIALSIGLLSGCGEEKNATVDSAQGTKTPATAPAMAPIADTGAADGSSPKPDAAVKASGVPAIAAETKGATVEVPSMSPELAAAMEEKDKMYLPSSFVLLKSSKGRPKLAAEPNLYEGFDMEAIASTLLKDESFSKQIKFIEQRLKATHVSQKLARNKFEPTNEEIQKFFTDHRQMFINEKTGSPGVLSYEHADRIREMLCTTRWEAYVWEEYKKALASGKLKKTEVFSRISGARNPGELDKLGIEPSAVVLENTIPGAGGNITFSELRGSMSNFPDLKPGMAGGAEPAAPSGQPQPGSAGFSNMPADILKMSFADMAVQQIFGVRLAMKESAESNLEAPESYLKDRTRMVMGEYFRLNPLPKADPAKISGEEALRFYSENLSRYTPDPVIWLNWIILDGEDEARKVHARLEAGERFEKLIEEKTGIKTVHHESFVLPDLRDDLKGIVEGLMPGQFSPIVNIDGSYTIVSLIAVEKKPALSFSVVEGQVRQDCAEAKVRQAREKAIAALREKTIKILRK